MNVRLKLALARVALVASVGSAAARLIFAANAFGQEPAPPGVAEVERVIVTGSMIPTAEEVGSNPVFSLNRDLINKSAAGTTEQLLQRLPVMNGATIPVQNNATSGAGPTGTAALALRGLDPGASLVLIDHRRVAPFPGSANSGYGFVDLTTIPITTVQSIDILKDGASTTYGSDAVEYRGDILFGVGDDKTSITGDMFYYKHHDMFNRDRGNSLAPPFSSSNAVP